MAGRVGFWLGFVSGKTEGIHPKWMGNGGIIFTYLILALGANGHAQIYGHMLPTFVLLR